MLNTFVKNSGMTNTIIYDNQFRDTHYNQIKWDADYDGKLANIYVDTDFDGNRNKYNMRLDNNDLANLLNIQGVNMPIDRRLKTDFIDKTIDNYPFLELPTPQLQPRKPILQEVIDRRISSPAFDEELIVPLTIQKKPIHKYTLTSKRKHRRPKTHITHRVYKKPKSNTKSKTKSYKKSKSMPTLSLF